MSKNINSDTFPTLPKFWEKFLILLYPPMCILLKLDDTEFGVSNFRFSNVVKEKPLGGELNPPFGKGRVSVFLLGLPSQGMTALVLGLGQTNNFPSGFQLLNFTLSLGLPLNINN